MGWLEDLEKRYLGKIREIRGVAQIVGKKFLVSRGRRLLVRKSMLNKYDIPRNKEFFRYRVINSPPSLIKRITNKDAFSTSGMEFICSRLMNIAKTPNCA